MLPALWQQIAPPAPGQEPWPYITFMLILACSFLGRELLKRADTDIADWKQSAKDAAAGLKDATGALNTLSDTVEAQGREQTANIEKNRSEIIAMRQDIAAMNARLDGTTTRRRSP